MRILILEDEMRAAFRLVKMVEQLRPQAEIYEPLESISEAVDWFGQNADPDILIMDIELADGPSFQIFKSVNTKAAVIFVTAFNQYALQAFKHQGLAYLLKPVKEDELQEAILRAESIKQANIDYARLARFFEQKDPTYQERILVKFGQKYRAVEIRDIAYIHTEDKTVIAVTNEGRDVPLDQTLEQMEGILDPAQFFRINRKIIVSHQAIDSMYAWSRSRMKLELLPVRNIEAIVATERAGNFKKWLEGK